MKVPEKGWFLSKEKVSASLDGIKVYYDGKQVGGIQKFSVEFDVEKGIPILHLEVVPFGGLLLDACFEQFGGVPEPLKFQSTEDPVELLKKLSKEKEVEE